PTIFYGDLAVLGGQVIFNSDVKLETLALNNATVNFKSAYSSANIVYAANNAAISLANNYLPNALFAEEISLNADLILDVNFNSASSDKIYASSITIFTGRKLIINAPFYDELIVKKIPIIFSEDYFAFNQNGNSINNTENIFYYDSTRYDLYFDIGQKVLYIKNVLPPDQNSAKTRNQKEIENIVNENGYLKYPISNMNANKKRLSYDDLSGAFYANIFSAMLYGGNESIFNQIEQIPSYKLWTNVNISGLRFHNNGQTIGDFKTEGFGIMLGKDLQAAEWGRMGAFVSGNDRKFSQAQNRGDLQDIGIGVYGNLFFKGFNSKGIFSAMYAGGRVEREINFNESYYRPHSNISLIGFNAAISLDYMVLAQNKNDLQRLVGPVFSYEANQINIFPTKEMDGSIANLYFDSQPIFRHAVKGGMEFRQTNKGLEFFGRLFIGRNLNAKQEFDMEILDLRRTFKVESDDENLLFYGWLTGVNLSLTQSINLGMQAGMQTNGNFQSYNANLNANYKFSKTIKPRANRKTIKTKIPVLEFIDGTAELTPKSKTELASFGQRLAKTFPNFRRLTIFIMLNNSNDRGSARASEVSAARARNVKRILYANKVPPEKIWDATRKIRTRGRIAVRVAR
ncbi:MAG: autotransporter domain-containing protein, partial [Elusimicrobiota bacterium]|nr:autotransporter domain-containing protein [Elusimicrobiota bacterium]